MRCLNLALAERSYPILIGNDLLQSAENLQPYLRGPRVAVISNTTVAPLYLSTVVTSLEKVGVGVTAIILPDGEKFKNWESLNAIYDGLLAARCDRGTTLIALGGGVIGDLAGFAAATYQRGVSFIQIPTTLLSQVDSSVGGKTGINHPRGKNMVGAFWQPKLVVADTRTLRSLPARELSAGLAEVIKYGLIRDLPFLEWLEANMDSLVGRDDEALAYAIERSCRNKAEVVADDEFETAKEGGRALLNLGHTFGHAIESGMGYGNWLHGEAVAAGTVMAAELSRRLGWLSEADVDRVRDILQRAGLPVCGPVLGAEQYLEFMSHDKKVVDGRMRLVLLKSMGSAVTTSDAGHADILATINACCHE
ncbi:MAG: 3-dehydroquinate synthase [Pseudomonadota bacterium]